MKTILIMLVLVTACSTQQPKSTAQAQPKPIRETPQFYRDYKITLSYCTNYILDNPSNDVLRLARADDVAIGKVMDGEILKCLDFNMELIYELKD
jgi:hypothetical protein